ncbi:hypothetical protein LJ737_04525 [Hymenobacter sp. 15J16-1T3B]|uniref:hypothetical protein n=1 Tax=Hymenobacter sp. 15J16-1T3B TaxID=2886941 RepID=UPI001D0FF300|nr:hypothetical protein [Hymenobacter sp. 15J16-1T3B]MCC3156489.1 hypothetical protein [Hymenobacter sp. 15J16-1T3B]
MSDTRHYFSNAAGSIDFVPGDYVRLRWSGQPLTSPELRALYVHARNVLERKGLRRLLVDHRAMPAAPEPADRQWLLTQWLPDTVARTRATHYAALPAPDPARRLHTEPVVQDLRRYLTVALFDDPEQAAAWFHAA